MSQKKLMIASLFLAASTASCVQPKPVPVQTPPLSVSLPASLMATPAPLPLLTLRQTEPKSRATTTGQ